MNRARECAQVGGEADYYVGIESGLVERYGPYFEEAWAVIIAGDGKEQIGYSSGLVLPQIVVDELVQIYGCSPPLSLQIRNYSAL